MAASGYGRFRSTDKKPASTKRSVDAPVDAAPAKPAKRPRVAPAAEPAEADDDEPGDEIDDDQLAAFIEDLLAGRFRTKVTAEAIKENALALKHLLAARKEAGSVVDVAVAERILFEAARRARDAWLNFTTRIGPLLAADLGVDQERVTGALEPYVHQQLADLGSDAADFTGDA
ncbi:MAG: hypothetical protein JO290_12880 [Sphingomonadaceae bacterium]|nr:hypothetical protein [Sphingomonadaceae bacterium]